MFGFWVRWYGLVWGWVAIWIFSRAGAVRFPPPVFRGGALDYCTWIGYPKMADFFWVALTLTVGFVMGVGMDRARRSSGTKAWQGLAGVPGITLGVMALVGAAWTELSGASSSGVLAWLLLTVALIAPWLDLRWHQVPRDEGTVRLDSIPRRPWWPWISLALAVCWMVEPAWRERRLDALHEGFHLLFAQHALAGEMPGVQVQAGYGPLYTYSFIWWMKGLGMTVEMERRYFQFVQVVGTSMHLLALGLVGESPPVLIAGVLAMLGLSTASADLITYGWANALRTGFSVLAIILIWRAGITRSRRMGFIAGVLLSTGILYSPEFGISAAVGCVALTVTSRDRASVFGFFVGAAAAATGWWVVMFGSNSMEALLHVRGGYAFARLAGHGARPLPVFPRCSSFEDAWRLRHDLLNQISIWGPLAIASMGGVLMLEVNRERREDRSLLLTALIPVVIISHLPVIARPEGQQTMSAPFVVIAGMILLDLLRSMRVRLWRLAAVGVVCYSFIAPFGNLRTAIVRMFTPASVEAAVDPRVPRLGRLALTPRYELFAVLASEAVQSRSASGERVFLAAPYHLIVPFLADRAALAPYPSTEVATTPEANEIVMHELEKVRPPVALVSPMGLDVPYAVEHPEQWKYLEENYRPVARVGDLEIRVRKKSTRE